MRKRPTCACGFATATARQRLPNRSRNGLNNFAIYLVGTLLIVGALAFGAHLLGAPPAWIGIGATVLVGLGILSGVTRTRQKDAPAD
jgi:hypothetical protein